MEAFPAYTLETLSARGIFSFGVACGMSRIKYCLTGAHVISEPRLGRRICRNTFLKPDSISAGTLRPGLGICRDTFCEAVGHLCCEPQPWTQDLPRYLLLGRRTSVLALWMFPSSCALLPEAYNLHASFCRATFCLAIVYSNSKPPICRRDLQGYFLVGRNAAQLGASALDAGSPELIVVRPATCLSWHFDVPREICKDNFVLGMRVSAQISSLT